MQRLCKLTKGSTRWSASRRIILGLPQAAAHPAPSDGAPHRRLSWHSCNLSSGSSNTPTKDNTESNAARTVVRQPNRRNAGKPSPQSDIGSELLRTVVASAGSAANWCAARFTDIPAGTFPRGASSTRRDAVGRHTVDGAGPGPASILLSLPRPTWRGEGGGCSGRRPA
jgi:hypothetical protein